MKTLIILLMFCSVAFAGEYRGQKDRYSEALFRNDPEVLIALPKPKPQEIQVVVRDKDEKDPPIKVSACVEWNGECQETDEFKATVK